MSHIGMGGPAGVDHGHCHANHGSGMIHHPDQSASWNMAVQTERTNWRGITINPAIVIAISLFVSAVLITLPYILDAIQGDSPPPKKKTAGNAQASAPAGSANAPIETTVMSPSPVSATPDEDTTRFGQPRNNCGELPPLQQQQASPFNNSAHERDGSPSLYTREYSRFAETAARHYVGNPFAGPGYEGTGVPAGGGTLAPQVQRTQRHIPYYILSDSPGGTSPGKRRLMVAR